MWCFCLICIGAFFNSGSGRGIIKKHSNPLRLKGQKKLKGKKSFKNFCPIGKFTPQQLVLNFLPGVG